MKNIAVIVVFIMMLTLPITHFSAYKMGRQSMFNEFVSNNAYVIDGKLAYKQVVVPRGTCDKCHIGGFNAL